MKKLVMLLIITSVLFGCSLPDTSTPPAPVRTAPPVTYPEGYHKEESVSPENSSAEILSEDFSALDDIGNVSVEKNLFSVELQIPSTYIGETTQEELDAMAKENGYEAIVLNPDGSATYVMSKAQHTELMASLEQSIYDSLNDMIGSEDYPNITNIEANKDFTHFTITTTSTELSLTESFSTFVLYFSSGMYNAFNGTPIDNVHVDFVNESSGQIISSSDSSDMNNAD